MGLDQYAYAVMPHKENTDFSFEQINDDGDESYRKIAQWRKHPDLHGWMESLFNKKADEKNYEGKPDSFGKGRSFNCQPLRMTFQDLMDLKKAVINAKLPHTVGFFFGESMPEDREDDLKFIEDAIKAIIEGMEIYYDSWW